MWIVFATETTHTLNEHVFGLGATHLNFLTVFGSGSVFHTRTLFKEPLKHLTTSYSTRQTHH